MDYAEKLEAADAAEAALTMAISNLRKAADALGGDGWKKLDVPGRPSDSSGVVYMPPIDKPLELAEWPSLDEIKNLVEAHWRALAIAEEA